MHVLTGPDHLSAIATLSANVASMQAFWLGVRWGLGHSTGLIVVGITIILIRRNQVEEHIQVPDAVSNAFESLVGVFMILLGLYGMRRAWDKRPKSYRPVDDVELAVTSSSFHDESVDEPTVVESIVQQDDETEVSWRDRFSTRSLAIFAGIVHGLAGPGGVLGVLPAVQLHSATLATIYLGTFCAMSTLTMGIFATLYGSCSSSMAQTPSRAFCMEALSASLSLLVGITWIVLLSIGKLDDVFP